MELFSYKEGRKIVRPAYTELYDFIPQDDVAQSLYDIGRANGSDPLEAAMEVLRACAARSLTVGPFGDYALATIEGSPIGEWLSIPTKPGTVACLACPECGKMVPIERTIAHIPEIVYRADSADGSPDQPHGKEV